MEEPICATGMAARLRSQWDHDAGLGQNHNAVKFLGQDYERLKAQCLQSRKLFEDNLFPCAASSLGFDELGPRSAKTSGVRWMRPTVSKGGNSDRSLKVTQMKSGLSVSSKTIRSNLRLIIDTNLRGSSF